MNKKSRNPEFTQLCNCTGINTQKKLILIFLALLLTGFNIFSVSALDNEEENEILEQFKDTDTSTRLTTVRNKPADPQNRDFFLSVWKYLALNADYYTTRPDQELYLEVMDRIIEYISSDPAASINYDFAEAADIMNKLAAAGFEKSYTKIFVISSGRYPLPLRAAAKKALDNYRGSFFSNISAVIMAGNIYNMHQALNMAINESRLSILQKGRLCETAMKDALNYKTQDHREAETARNIIMISVRFFGKYRWSEAVPLVIEYFDRLTSVKNISSVKSDLLEVINSLGLLKTIEAARRLNMFLSVTNHLVEKEAEYDEEVISAIIFNLGQIGDISSFESLTHAQNAGYTQEIADMAEQAVSKLRLERR